MVKMLEVTILSNRLRAILFELHVPNCAFQIFSQFQVRSVASTSGFFND